MLRKIHLISIFTALIIVIGWIIALLMIKPETKDCKLQKHALLHQGNFFLTEIVVIVYLIMNRSRININSWACFLLFLFSIQELIFVHHIIEVEKFKRQNPDSKVQDCIYTRIFICGLFWAVFAQQIIFSLVLSCYLLGILGSRSDDDFMLIVEEHN